jgi:hypothetical protein
MAGERRMTEITLFTSAFVTVFLLGFQQQNVIHRHFTAAAITSLGIGTAQIILWKNIPSANVTEIAATLAGGPCGILAAMVSHPRIMNRKPSAKEQGS